MGTLDELDDGTLDRRDVSQSLGDDWKVKEKSTGLVFVHIPTGNEYELENDATDPQHVNVQSLHVGN